MKQKQDVDKPGSTKYQYFASISSNLTMLGYGCGMGWLSLATPLLRSDDTPLASGPISDEELSWAASLMSGGAIFGNLFYSALNNAYGSRNTVFALGIPQIISWLLLIFGRHIYLLFAARFLGGFMMGGAAMCVSLFVAEIANNEIRGTLGTIYQFLRNFGVLLAYALGNYFNYIHCSMMFIGITVLFYATFFPMPSTPQYLLQVNKDEAAERSYKFYKGFKNSNVMHAQEQDYANLKKVAREVKKTSVLNWQDIKASRKIFLIATVFPLLNKLTGAYVFLTYGTHIIANSGTLLPAKQASIPLAIMQLAGTFLTSQLVDTKGRKFLLILSLVGCALGHIGMTTFLVLHRSGVDTTMFHYTPVICMSVVVLLASAGIIPLTIICIVECFPAQTRSLGLTYGNVATNLAAFTVTKIFPMLTDKLGLEYTPLIFCAGCILGTVYVIFCVDETKGKDLNTLETNDNNNECSGMCAATQ